MSYIVTAQLGKSVKVTAKLVAPPTNPNQRNCSSVKKIDSMNHVLWCPSYSELRINRKLHDLPDLTLGVLACSYRLLTEH